MKMKKVKTSELQGVALDWAVATIEQHEAITAHWSFGLLPAFSTDWSQGGPIIEREISDLVINGEGEGRVHAYINSNKENEICRWGKTVLIAAMRCYVLSKVGDESNVPEELI